MYPIHLEQQYEKYWKTLFREFAAKVNGALFARLEKALSLTGDGADYRQDAPGDLLSFLGELRSRYGKAIGKERLASEVAAHLHLVDEWSRARTTEAIGKLYGRLNTPQLQGVTNRPTPDTTPGELWLTTARLRRSLTGDMIDRTVRSNVELISAKYRDYLDDIESVVRSGALSGQSFRSMRDAIVERTGVHESKAKFWARDQVSKFFGDVTRERQVNAGIPGYIWRTMRDARVRDSHGALEGTYHRWNNPPKAYRQSKGGMALVRVHPGQDFNCRCFAEPALGPEAAEREYRGPGVFAEQLPDSHFQATAGLAPAEWSGTGGLRERMMIDVGNPELRSAIDDAVRTIDRVMNINTGASRALSVRELGPGDVNFSEPVAGYYWRGSTALRAGNPFARTTVIHEMSHWIHRQILPRSTTADFQRIIDAIRDTAAHEKLVVLRKAAKSRALRSEMSYYLNDAELFARAMEQYAAVANPDPLYRNEFLQKRLEHPRKYWLDDDFSKVYITIDNLFRSIGWRN